jgi:hypothetical protein
MDMNLRGVISNNNKIVTVCPGLRARVSETCWGVGCYADKTPEANSVGCSLNQNWGCQIISIRTWKIYGY